MTRHVQLNAAEHASLRVKTERSAELGDSVMLAPAFPLEFRSLQSHYPIVFSKDATGEYRPIILFGFEDGENLFLDENGWNTGYVPLSIRMRPFLIGAANGDHDSLKVHIDLDHPRVNTDEGEALFDGAGQQTQFLADVSELLSEVHLGEAFVRPYISALDDLGLIEPFTLDVTMQDGQQGRLAGFYTVAEEKLANLDSDAVASLHQSGALMPLFMQIASISRFEDLVFRRNRKGTHV